MPKIITQSQRILRAVAKASKNKHRRIPVNRIAKYYDRVSNALAKIKDPNASLSNQEAYDLSASWRTAEYGRGGNYPFPFTRAEKTRARAWYDSQSDLAVAIGKSIKRTSLSIADEFGNMRVRDVSRRKLRLIWQSGDTSEPIRYFKNDDTFLRFLTLPQYKDAREKLGGRYGIAKVTKTGRVTKFVRSVKIKGTK